MSVNMFTIVFVTSIHFRYLKCDRWSASHNAFKTLSLALALPRCLFLCSALYKIFAYFPRFGPWGLSRLVSNLDSHREWNKVGAVQGILQHIWTLKKNIFPLTTSQAFEKLADAASADLSLHSSLCHQFLCQALTPNSHAHCHQLLTDDVNMWLYKLQSEVFRLEPGASRSELLLWKMLHFLPRFSFTVYIIQDRWTQF